VLAGVGIYIAHLYVGGGITQQQDWLGEFHLHHRTDLRRHQLYHSHPQLLPGYHDQPHHSKIP